MIISIFSLRRGVRGLEGGEWRWFFEELVVDERVQLEI